MKFQINYPSTHTTTNPTDEHIVHSMREAIKACWDCRHACQQALIQHCLNQGGNYAEKQHVKIMLDCIQICQITADFMTRGSYMHHSLCNACADVCVACAKSCEDLGDTEMVHCAEICWRTADSAREMGKAEKVA